MVERNVNTPPEEQIEFRIGINFGDVIAEGEDIFGDGVNVAARLEALAEPGGICVSRVVRDQVRDSFASRWGRASAASRSRRSRRRWEQEACRSWRAPLRQPS
jgi:class 3 adenylate cyclase